MTSVAERYDGVVVDTSAMVAIVTGEPTREWLLSRLLAIERRVMAAPIAVELGIVLETRTAEQSIGGRAVRDANIEVVPFGDDLGERALLGWRRFGKGRHPAALNFGDCFTYALADETGYPILCTGADFSRTDLPVLTPPG